MKFINDRMSNNRIYIQSDDQFTLLLQIRFCWIFEFFNPASYSSCNVDGKNSSSIFQIWNTNSGDLLAEGKPSDGDHDIRYSCIACSFTGKKVVWNFKRIFSSLML